MHLDSYLSRVTTVSPKLVFPAIRSQKQMKKITNSLTRLGLLQAAIFIVSISLSPPAFAGVFTSGSNDVFYSIGKTTGGTIRIAGSREDQAGYFSLTGTNFTFTALNALSPGGYASAFRISADGTRIVGSSESPTTTVGRTGPRRFAIATRRWVRRA